jgi:iron complex transport system permease protein
VPRPQRVLITLGALIIIALVVHVSLGSSDTVSPREVLRQIFRGPGDLSDRYNAVVWQIRLPRAIMCLLVGALLGTVGSAFQALLRNPLADPYIIGVSSGSAVGAAIAIVAGLGEVFGSLGRAGFGFVTGMLTLALVYRLALRRGVVDVKTLLLAGVSIGALLSALLSMILLLSGRNERDVLYFLMGDTSDGSWSKSALLLVALVVGFGILMVETRRLNAFAIGEETAQRLGVDVPRLTRIVLIAGGGMTAAAVGTVGIIGFVGLAAPHLSRRLLGVDWRWSMPGALALGALLLVSADVISQRAFSAITGTPGFDLPVGIVTSVLGAPSLILLLRKST